MVEEVLKKIEEKINKEKFSKFFPKRWLLIKVLENDEYLRELLQKKFSFNIAECCKAERHYLSEAYNLPSDEVITEERYKAIFKLTKNIFKRPKGLYENLFNRILDKLLLNPYTGIPLFFLVMFIVFKLTFVISAPFSDWIDGFVAFLGKYIGYLLENINPLLGKFVEEAVIGGIGFFATFLPVLMFMYLALALLEHSGFLARQAFLMDRIARKFSLTGKSIFPLILGFGCNVPAILATRTLEEEPLRKLTALIIPFMSCSARLPVYALIAYAFFPNNADIFIFSLYILGIITGFIVAFILSKTIFRRTLIDLPFLVEIPPYRLPSLGELLRAMWIPVWEFIHRVGGFILIANIIFWLSLNIKVANEKESLLTTVAKEIQPIFKPLGFGERWENVAVLFGGFLAKEIVVTSYGTILAVEKNAEEKTFTGTTENLLQNFIRDLEKQIINFFEAIKESVKALISIFLPNLFEIEKPPSEIVNSLTKLMTPAAAISFAVFILLYTPCIATVGVIFQEFGLKWALFSVFINFVSAWLVSFIIYHLSRLFLP